MEKLKAVTHIYKYSTPVARMERQKGDRTAEKLIEQLTRRIRTSEKEGFAQTR